MKKVLVVEDNRDNLRLITYALQRGGYDVVAAATGEEGLRIAIQERPFFIVMDINLPVMDGLETIRCIRASDADGGIPIVALTSYAMEGDRKRIMEAGCNAYFEKPIDPLTIVERIESALEISRG